MLEKQYIICHFLQSLLWKRFSKNLYSWTILNGTENFLTIDVMAKTETNCVYIDFINMMLKVRLMCFKIYLDLKDGLWPCFGPALSRYPMRQASTPGRRFQWMIDYVCTATQNVWRMKNIFSWSAICMTIWNTICFFEISKFVDNFHTLDIDTKFVKLMSWYPALFLENIK